MEHIKLPGSYHSAIDFIKDLHENKSVEQNGEMDSFVLRYSVNKFWISLRIRNIPHHFSKEHKNNQNNYHVETHTINLSPEDWCHNLVSFLDGWVLND